MKIFKVSINNNPGGWKSGEDPSELVIADSREEAIEKVKNGWTSDYDYKNAVYEYGFFPKDSLGVGAYINENTTFSGVEIKFSGYDITTIREEKLKRIIK
jgi:hypothetical protein